jgi:hypothetical protein
VLVREGECLPREFQPARPGLRADDHPFPHRPALARVERLPVCARDKLCHPFAGQFQDEPAAPGHGEDPAIGPEGVRPEAAAA